MVMPVLKSLPGSLPTEPLGPDVDPVAVAKQFQDVLKDLRAEYLDAGAMWRDTFALTGSMRTFYSPSSITAAWQQTSTQRDFQSLTLELSSAKVQQHRSGAAWIDCQFTFETQAAPSCSCAGIVSVIRDIDGTWKIWVLRTVLQRLQGQLDVDTLEPQPRTDYVDPTQIFDCIVVGGGS